MAHHTRAHKQGLDPPKGFYYFSLKQQLDTRTWIESMRVHYWIERQGTHACSEIDENTL